MAHMSQGPGAVGAGRGKLGGKLGGKLAEPARSSDSITHRTSSSAALVAKDPAQHDL